MISIRIKSQWSRKLMSWELNEGDELYIVFVNSKLSAKVEIGEIYSSEIDITVVENGSRVSTWIRPIGNDQFKTPLGDIVELRQPQQIIN